MVRQRGGKAGPGGARRCLGRKDSSGSFMETKEEGRHSTLSVCTLTVLSGPYMSVHAFGCVQTSVWPCVLSACAEMEGLAAPPADQVEKVRKRYRKKKSQLEEAFPSYLQVLHLHIVACTSTQCNASINTM